MGIECWRQYHIEKSFASPINMSDCVCVVISFSKGEHVFDDYFCKEVIFIFSEGLWSCVG
jgi:hypothetical protein